MSSRTAGAIRASHRIGFQSPTPLPVRPLPGWPPPSWRPWPTSEGPSEGGRPPRPRRLTRRDQPTGGSSGINHSSANRPEDASGGPLGTSTSATLPSTLVISANSCICIWLVRSISVMSDSIPGELVLDEAVLGDLLLDALMELVHWGDDLRFDGRKCRQVHHIGNGQAESRRKVIVLSSRRFYMDDSRGGELTFELSDFPTEIGVVEQPDSTLEEELLKIAVFR